MIGSKKFSVLTIYGGFGYNIGTTDYSTLGTYVFDRVDTGNGVLLPLPPGPDNPITVTDPFDLEFEENSFRGQLGLKLKFGPVYINADYTLASTQILAVGLGFSFKE